jgi:hypothetical protein
MHVLSRVVVIAFIGLGCPMIPFLPSRRMNSFIITKVSISKGRGMIGIVLFVTDFNVVSR